MGPQNSSSRRMCAESRTGFHLTLVAFQVLPMHMLCALWVSSKTQRCVAADCMVLFSLAYQDCSCCCMTNNDSSNNDCVL